MHGIAQYESNICFQKFSWYRRSPCSADHSAGKSDLLVTQSLTAAAWWNDSASDKRLTVRLWQRDFNRLCRL